MEKMREEFEAWMTESGREFSVNVVNDRLGLELSYVPFQAEIAWSAWKASRAALRVELPQPEPGDGAMVWSVDVEVALDNAGVSYK